MKGFEKNAEKVFFPYTYMAARAINPLRQGAGPELSSMAEWPEHQLQPNAPQSSDMKALRRSHGPGFHAALKVKEC